MRCNTTEGGFAIKLSTSQPIWCHKIPHTRCFTVGVNQSVLYKSSQPASEFIRLQHDSQLPSRHAFSLRQSTECDSLALRQLKTLISLSQQPHHLWLHNTALNRHLHPVRALLWHWRWTALRQQPVVDQVKTAAFALHQTQIMEHLGHPLIATTACMQHIARRHAKWQAAWVDYLQTVGMQIKINIALLGIRSMYQRIH